jgi:ubiquitin-like-conjugating enzyme ATG3
MNLVNNFINTNITTINNLVETFIPILQESQFFEKGVLTPEEFVLTGDQLVHSCGTWEWATGKKDLKKTYLPEDKQFIIFKNAVCLNRINNDQLNIILKPN